MGVVFGPRGVGPMGAELAQLFNTLQVDNPQ